MSDKVDLWHAITTAHLPATALPILAAIRHRADVFVQRDNDSLWVHWPMGQLDVVRCLLPIRDVQFFRSEGGHWFPLHSRLPSSVMPPATEKQCLASILIPDRLEQIPPDSTTLTTTKLRVVTGGSPQVTTALRCAVESLRGWADTATTRELSSVRGALNGEQAMLLGEKLPSIPNATRYWGTTVLVPVGYRIDPLVPLAVVRELVGASETELVVFDDNGLDVVPKDAFEILSRSHVRLALKPRTPNLM